MENKTLKTVRSTDNQQFRGQTDKETTISDNTNSKDGVPLNPQPNSTPEDTNSGSDQEDRELSEVEYLTEYPIDRSGTLLYNKAIAEFDESSDDVQLSEHYKFRDKEYDEHGNF